MPLDSLELTTEFGTLNFEDFATEVTTEANIIDEPEVAIPDNNEFEKEMKKVVDIMKIAGDDLPASTIKKLMTDLVIKAKEESRSREEEEEKIKVVGTLVNMFKEQNAQRAQENFEQRKPQINPVKDQLEEIDFSQILINKAQNKPEVVQDFRDILEAPQGVNQVLVEKAKNRPEVIQDFRDVLELPRREKPRLHVKTKQNNILINKAKLKPDNVRNFDQGLTVPVIKTTPKPTVVTQVPSPTEETTIEDFSQILIEKSKLKPEILKDFNTGLELPKDDIEEEYVDEFAFEEDFGITPEPPVTTLRPKMVNLTQLLSIPSTKDMIEDHIMDMIIENPQTAAADLAELFDLENEEEKEQTEEELFEMMEEDPLAVTSAFTDLIMAQKNDPTTEPPTTPFEPVKIEEVPEEVKGKMERMKMRPQAVREDEEVVVQVGQEPLRVSNELLKNMMTLIEKGQLSHKEVIEELINNGVLPVEVTDIGRIPIVVGGVPVRDQTPALRSQPLRKMPDFKEPSAGPREAVSLGRLQQLRVKEPQMIMKDEHHIMTEVGLDDPDGDFEMVKLPPRKSPLAVSLPVPDPTKTTEEKDIEILSSMMELYDQGLISDDELEQMVIMMESEGVLDVDLEELGIEKEKPTPSTIYRPYSYSGETFGEGPSVDQYQPYYSQTVRPYVHPAPEKAERGKSLSYAHFSMKVPESIQSTAKPPELPPPSPESLHKAPFFQELSNMNNPFDDPFEHEFKKAKLDFKPVQEVIKPGPAPPYYMSARLPAPPQFSAEELEEDAFKLKPGSKPFDFERFEEPVTNGPREPFPPPIEFKRHARQPLPLILHKNEDGFEHPHFDIPDSLINPKAYMESLRVPIAPPKHLEPSRFLPRKGRLNYQDFYTTVRSKRKSSNVPIYDPPVTGYSQVDRKMDEIRRSYIKGDSIGANFGH